MESFQKTDNWQKICEYIEILLKDQNDVLKNSTKNCSFLFVQDDYLLFFTFSSLTGDEQAGVDGEEVKRKIAALMAETNKVVYGVFIANKIDSNTAETFRIGCWFNQKDEELSLQIVPFTLKQFAAFFQHMFLTDQHDPETFLRLFETCFTAKKEGKGPVWKRRINDIVMAASQA